MQRVKTRIAAAAVAAGLAHHPSGRGAGSNGWSHYDKPSELWVGGDNNGCDYASDWSNC
ncbi:MAG: hypothetical protein ACREE7_04950 [Dongiaceae bacterium]